MMHRLINISVSLVNYKTELDLIQQITVNNGYNTTTIDNILSK